MRALAGALILNLVFAIGCRKEESFIADAGGPRALPGLTKLGPGSDIKTVMLPSAAKPIANFRLLFLSGSVDDPKGKEGITALAATVMAKGGTRSLTSAQLGQRLFPMAAELDVQVGKEMVTFVGRVHRDHLQAYLPILLDVILRPRWDPKELQRLRNDAISDIEKRLRTGDDENLGKAALQWLLYRGHPYANYSGGTVAGLKAIRMADLKAHAKRVFTRARLLIGLSGAVDHRVASRLKTALARLPIGSLRPPLRVEAKPARTKVLLIEKECLSTAISLGHRYRLKRTSPDFYAAYTGNSVFGEHRQTGGRLFDALRAKRGLNYGDYSYLEHFVQDGWTTYPLPNMARRQQYFSIWVRPVEHAHRVFALRAALYELNKLLREGITEAELKQTTGFLAGYSRMWEQTDSRRLGFVLDDHFYGGGPLLAGLRKAMPGLSVQQVNTALRKHIDPSRLQIVMVTKGAKALKAELVSQAASPIVYSSPKGKKLLAEDQKIKRFPLGLKAEEIRVIKATDLFER